MNNNSFIIQGNKLFHNEKALIVCNAIIQDFIVIDDSIVILVDPNGSQDDQNIYCYQISGKLKWQIPPADKLHHENYYTSVYVSEDASLQAYSINGVEITIDKLNGNILKKELIK